MKKDDEKLIRQLSLVSFLLNRTRPALSREIRKVVEGYATMTDTAFKKRFFEDRYELRHAGIAIESVPSEDGSSEAYYLPSENYYLPELGFTDDELTALQSALYLLHGRFAYERPLRLALANLTRGRPNPQAADIARVAVMLDPDEEGSRYGRLLDRLEEAVARRKTVVFPYRKPAETSVKERTVDPYGLFLVGGHWYVVGRDHARDANRMFRIGRIQGSVHYKSKKKSDFTVPRSFDPEAYLARPPWLLGEHKGDARIRVSEDLSWWVERTYPRMRLAAQHEDGSEEFDTPYADADALVSFALSLGRKVRIERPEGLRAHVLRALADIRDAHTQRGPAADDKTRTRAVVDAFPSGTPRVGALPGNGAEMPGPSGPGISPDRLGRTLTLMYYLLEAGCDGAVLLGDIERDLGLTRTEVAEDLSLLNLVNSGGGMYVIYAEIEEDRVIVERELLSEHMAEPARLTPLMAKALLLALDLVGPEIPLGGHTPMASARSKIAAVCAGSTPVGELRSDDLQRPDVEVLRSLNDAIRERRLVRMEYYTRSRERLNERTVEPQLLHRSRDSWYVEAFCRRAGDRRTFRLDLIKSAVVLEETFTPRYDVAAPALSGVSTTEIPVSDSLLPGEATPGWAVLRISAELAALAEESGLVARMVSLGEAEVSLPFLDQRWLVTEVLRYAGRAVLIAPEDLRTRVANTAEELLSFYEGAADFSR